MLADAHAHLAMPQMEADLSDVLVRARHAGVTRILTCATSLADAARNLEIASRHAEFGLLAAAGFHPHQASQWDESSEASLRALVGPSPQAVAVGEVGLDFHYNLSPPDTQVEVLRRQVRLARSIGLPLVVHCRNARQRMREVFLEEQAREAGGMLHCYSEDADFARFCLDQGFFVSFSGILTFRGADQVREAALVVPLDRVLVETDSPYLAPEPHRGRRNEPALVVEVARRLAALKGVALEELADATTANFASLFGRPRDLTKKARLDLT